MAVTMSTRVLEIPFPTLTVQSADHYRLESDCRIDGVVHRLFFEVAGAPVVERIEPFVCALLAPAQALGLDIVAHGAVSPVLLANLDLLQRQFAAWWPDKFRVIAIRPDAAEPMDISSSMTRGGCCCFSLGVDSMHSTLSHQDELTCLVYAHGFDTDLSATDLRRRISTSAQAAAAALGKPLTEIATNIRQITDPIVWWGYQGGGFLGALAMLMSSRADRLLIPGAWSAEQLRPWSIHPDIDPLWSTEHIRVESDALVGRIDKVAAVAASPLVMRHLRVCWHASTAGYNCGRCPKCLRTQLALRAFRAVPARHLFSGGLSLRRVAFSASLPDNEVIWYREILAALRLQAHRDRPLEWALTSAIEGRYSRGYWKPVRRTLGALKKRVKDMPGAYRLRWLMTRMRGTGQA
ncbi:MAG: hypothetical protein ABI859_03695 [Pseudomonadota bacterium]